MAKKEKDSTPLIKVRAKRKGFFEKVRRREGEIFMVKEHEFSKHWMEKVVPKKKGEPEPEVEPTPPADATEESVI